MLGMGSRMLTLTLALILTPTLTLTLPHPHPHPHPHPNPTLPQPYRSLCAVERSLLGRLGHRPSRLGFTLRAHRLARDDGAHHRTLRRALTPNPNPNPNPKPNPKPKPNPNPNPNPNQVFCAALAAALALVAFHGDRWLDSGRGAAVHVDGWRPCPDVAGALVRCGAA